MKRFLSMYRVEQKIFFRSPDVILFCLAMPLVVFVVITRPGVKFCVSVFRQSQEWRWKAGRILA